MVLKRFAWKVGLFVCFSAAQAAMGHGFLAPLASLSLGSAILALVVAGWRGERVASRHYTSFDEAAWFLLLGLSLRDG